VSDRNEDSAYGRELAPALRPDYTERTLHAIAGPHIRRFDAEGRKLLFGAEFRVSHEANRMGYRLEGPVLASTGDELLSFGLAAGAIQVARSGLPILLMADHQTAGGYPVPATVVSASLPVAAQLAPGDTITFREVTPAHALQMRAALLAALQTIRG
jgi:antagonist of KipI